MQRGSTSVSIHGAVSPRRPDDFSAFGARAGQQLTLHTEGGGLKTSAGIELTHLPSGRVAAVDPDTPFVLPASGRYLIRLHADLMSEGPFGDYLLRVDIR